MASHYKYSKIPQDKLSEIIKQCVCVYGYVFVCAQTNAEVLKLEFYHIRPHVN